MYSVDKHSTHGKYKSIYAAPSGYMIVLEVARW